MRRVATLCPAGIMAETAKVLLGELCALGQMVAGDHHIVVGVQPDRRREGLQPCSSTFVARSS